MTLLARASAGITGMAAVYTKSCRFPQIQSGGFLNPIVHDGDYEYSQVTIQCVQFNVNLFERQSMMGLIKEFREFAIRGNVVDLAVGVIMGAAFGKIVSSLVTDVLTPPIGYLIGGIKFTDLKINLPTKSLPVPDLEHPGQFLSKELPEVPINYGNFLQSTFDFLIIAFCIFMLVKVMNKLKKKEEVTPTVIPPDIVLLTEIRDLLKAKSNV